MSRIAEKLISRERLLERVLGDARDRRLTFIVAPAGFGKSTLLAQLAQRMRATGGWTASIVCQSDNREPEAFFNSVRSALRDARLVTERGESSLSDLADQICQLSARGVLLIDEFDLVDSKTNERLLHSFARQLPAGCHVIVATRDAPKLSLVRLQLQGTLDTVEAEDLRFSAAETLELLSDVMSAEESSEISERAEGWPLVLQLTRLRTRQNQTQGVAGGAPRLPASDIFEYLAAEVFGTLDRDTQEFLADVSVLSVIEPAVADAIRGREDSGKYILRLTALRPIVSIDQQPLRARLHPLFRDFLQSVGERNGHERLTTLHTRAARHLATQGKVYAAVEHALRARDESLAADIVAKAGGSRLHVSETKDVVFSLLQLLPRELVQSRPRLRTLRVMQFIKEGYVNDAIQDFQQLERHLAREPGERDPELQFEIELVRPMIEVFEAERKLEPPARDSLDALIAAAHDERFSDPRALVMALAADRYLLHRYGPFDRAVRRAEEMFQQFESERLSYLVPDGQVHRALVAIGRCEFAAAERLLRTALRQRVEIFGDADSNVCLHTNALLGKLYYLQDSLETSMAHLQAVPPGRPVFSAHLVEGAEAYRARIEFARGNIARSLSLLQAARGAAGEWQLLHLGNSLAAVQIELYCALEQRQAAQELAAEIDLPRLWAVATQPFSLPWQEVEVLAKAVIGLALLNHRSGAAAASADQFYSLAQAYGSSLALTLAEVLKACTWRAQGEQQRALGAIREALSLSVESAAYRVFLDQGPAVVSLVQKIAESGDPRLTTYATAIVDADRHSRSARLAVTKLLTSRERDVLDSLAKYSSTKEIARHLSLAPETIRYHLKAIYTKLGVHRRADALVCGRQTGLLRPEDPATQA